MTEFQDFFVEEFAEVETVTRKVKFGGKEREMMFKPISAEKGDEIRKSCRTVKVVKGMKQVEINQEQFTNRLIIETVVYPNLHNKKLQENWGVIGAEDLLNAMKRKMLDGEFAELGRIVTEINGYDQSIEEKADEIKN